MKVEAYVEIVNDRLQPTISSRNSNKPAYCQLSCVKDTSNKHVLLISHSNKTTVSKYYVRQIIIFYLKNYVIKIF